MQDGVNALLGCHIGVMKRILGGKSGNSGGKVNRALKKPPSLGIKSVYRKPVGEWMHTRAYRQGCDRTIKSQHPENGKGVGGGKEDKRQEGEEGGETNPIIIISHS
jgi:hypothetical protein